MNYKALFCLLSILPLAAATYAQDGGLPSVGDGNTTPQQYRISVNSIQGDVKDTNGGIHINCINGTGDCTANISNTTNIELLATAYSGYQFSHWTNCPSPSGNRCYINNISQNLSITAYFSVIDTTSSSIISHEFGGTREATGINPAYLSLRFEKGFFDLSRSTDQVNYTHVVCNDGTQGIGYTDHSIALGTTYWYRIRTSTQSVSCNSSTGWSSFSSAYQVDTPVERVHFDLSQPSIDSQQVGEITGTLGNQTVQCGNGSHGTGKCNFVVDINTTATLTVTANAGFTFKEWFGCSSVNNNECNVVLTQNKMSVYPVFEIIVDEVTGSESSELDKGLMAYYCFDDSNDLGMDCSGNGNNGTPKGGVSSTTGIASSGAASFGGYDNSGQIHIPNSSSLQFNDFMTVSYFVKLSSLEGMDGYGRKNKTTNSHTVFAKSHDRSGFFSRVIVNNSDEAVSFMLENDRYTNNKYSIHSGGINSSYKAIQNDWTHVVLKFSIVDNKAYIYLNGQLASSKEDGQINFSIANKEDLYLGRFSDYWYPLHGLLDEVRFYNRLLSDTEIKELANIDFNKSTAHITNISTRAYTSTGLESVIAGFVIKGAGACDLMIRGFGKGIGLSPNLDTQLLLQTFPQAEYLAGNTSWEIDNPVSSIPSALHLPHPSDAGIYTRLNAGAYTATMTPQNVTGIGLIGVDEVNCDAGTQLVNISTRAEDRTGVEAMIAGFTIKGEGTIKLMIRGFGSGLGLSSCLNTQIELQKFPSGELVATNDDWQTATNANEIPQALQLPNATDAGLLIELPAGAYTAIMTPKTGSCNGIGLIGVDVVQ